jgi:ubiquinone/menaquinone biosynthesis C-methylase UbiE
MPCDDQTRWDRQHALSPGADQPSSFLRHILESDAWVIPGGLALDIAAGTGRNAIFLAERGFSVVAIDVSSVALEHGRRRALKSRFAYLGSKRTWSNWNFRSTPMT